MVGFILPGVALAAIVLLSLYVGGRPGPGENIVLSDNE